MAAFAKDYAKQEQPLKQKGEALRQTRDDAIRRAHRDGLPMTVIGEIIGISSQRVSQIVRS